MTAEEKAKLYSAINYEENAVPATYPEHFIESSVDFVLKKLVVLLHDPTDRRQPIILLTTLTKVQAKLEQRPVSQGVMVSVQVGDFFVDGSPLRQETPRLLYPFDGIYAFNRFNFNISRW